MSDAYGDVLEKLVSAVHGGAAVIVTTHRPEVLAFSKRAEELAELTKVLVATYGLESVSRAAGVDKSFRLKLVDYTSLTGDAEKEFYEVFVGGLLEQ